MEYTTKNWPFKWFGVWKEYGDTYSNYPSVWSFVDKQENSRYDKDMLLAYLNSGYIVMTTSRMSFPSPINGETGQGTLAVRTDGVWLWYDTICELIELYDLAIPEAFYEHIKANDFSVPTVNESQIEMLEHPSHFKQ